MFMGKIELFNCMRIAYERGRSPFLMHRKFLCMKSTACQWCVESHMENYHFVIYDSRDKVAVEVLRLACIKKRGEICYNQIWFILWNILR